VNGGLFSKNIKAPRFNKRSREMLIDSGVLGWASINPDIFGSMMQAVVTVEDRSSVGMHYTSVVNIMKVIEPLFLNDLYEEFDKAKGSQDKLNKLLARLSKIKIFDPACGSGNFLIIAYKELRRLEMKILRESGQIALSNISLDQFYGIEIDDFSHEISILSLWLAKHQMSIEFFENFGKRKPTLPLKSSGNIVKGNACRLEWNKICPKQKDDETYVLGNPPYVGARNQNSEQKEDMKNIFNNDYSSLDYVTAWMFSGANYISNSKIKLAFVATSSVCQGEQVSMIWPRLLKYNIEIYFAFTSFGWKNSAKDNAGVSVIIIGIRNINSEDKFIHLENGHSKHVKNINGYISEGPNIFISKKSKPLSFLPIMSYGNQPIESGYLRFNEEKRKNIIENNIGIEKYIRKVIGSQEFLRDINRYCFWIEDEDLEHALRFPEIKSRISKVREYRINGGQVAKSLVSKSHQFRYRHIPKNNQIIIPCTSSENRNYIPCGFFDNSFISLNSIQVIFDAEPWIFSILSSRIHVIWVKSIAGRLDNRIRYSCVVCWNNFPFPKISENSKQELLQCTFDILEEREKHSEKTISQLYDPDKMPDGLREAHHLNDLAVERCYRPNPFNHDEERLKYLFSLYEKMIEIENSEGTLFAEAAGKKRKRRVDA
jgi:hypothetical protein